MQIVVLTLPILDHPVDQYNQRHLVNTNTPRNNNECSMLRAQ